jgi:hypothetical protein
MGTMLLIISIIGSKLSRKLVIYQFGIRHRSMMRSCARKPENLSFVISQEGSIRCATKLEDRLVLWKNLPLHLVDFVEGDFPLMVE